ncbi:MAG: LON peptidase substrate-binding domain-containing protein [Alphaproteobacteria bacterium]|nr:LON peptidase substrate-binding domain-containing protein [Alphaproteobacteria bacterium]
MSRHPFDPEFAALPRSLPVFPLPGVLLLPGGKLPLNIFEPRYLAMVQDALAAERMIGMIQPTEDERPSHPPALYRTGCAGRIVSFSETDDGRFLITLAGLCRFDVDQEIATTRGYRRVVPQWDRYAQDYADGPPPQVDRARLLKAVEAYFKVQGLSADWEAIKGTPDGRLVVALAMVCPFAPNEKQALLEAPDGTARAAALVALMEMAAVPARTDDETPARH